MKITLVKKRLADGSWCNKCQEVDALMHKHGHYDKVNEVLIADEKDPLSPGMMMATRLKVERAPFFVVERDDGSEEVYTVYLKFAKEVLNLSGDDLKRVFSSK